ncbi:MAG: hypothetical protein H6621_03605 [Halobacteriovoraceae bacterium]|nr:hypothetical protein [Halobacteriovoraceae bacterium]MCB9094134.1 hypothetical protein [Halobacteriovoraceae bacterium]
MKLFSSFLILFVILQSCSLHRYGSKPSGTSLTQDKKLLIYTLNKAYIGKYFAPGFDRKIIYKQIKKIPKKSSSLEFMQKVSEIFQHIPDNSLKITNSLLPLTENTQNWKIDNFQIGNKKGLIVSLPYFENYEDSYWNNFIETFQHSMKNKQFVVLDLRGSHGLDDTMGLKLAKILNGNVLRHPILRQHHVHTKQALAIINNFYNFHYPEKKIQFQKTILPKSKIPLVPIEFPKDKIGFSKKYSYEVPIIVLIDGGCSRACESTIMALEENPYHILVGTHSSGTIHFNHLGVLYLPFTELFVYIPTSFSEYSDGRFLEKKGITPHILLEDGDKLEEVLLVALNKIRK